MIKRTELILEAILIALALCSLNGFAVSAAAQTPLVWWRLDQTSGLTVADAAGSGITGVLVGPSYHGGGSCGRPHCYPYWFNDPQRGPSLGFDGADDQVIADAQPGQGGIQDTAMPLGAYTKATWVKILSYTLNPTPNIITGSFGHAFWMPSGKLSAGHNTQYTAVQDPVAIPANTWVHVAVTYDPSQAGGTMKLYKNGVVCNSGAAPCVATNVATHSDRTLRIGMYNYSHSTALDGLLQDVRVYNVALTAAQVASLVGGTPPPPATRPNPPSSLRVQP
jgi:Concanavalin A-like lectin/glucanases superfamily